MRKFIILMFFTLLNLSCFASVRLESGSLSCLKGEKTIGVSLDLTRIKYKKDLPFKDFLALGRRVSDWKERSLDYFVKSSMRKVLNMILVQQLIPEPQNMSLF